MTEKPEIRYSLEDDGLRIPTNDGFKPPDSEWNYMTPRERANQVTPDEEWDLKNQPLPNDEPQWPIRLSRRASELFGRRKS